MTLIFWRKLEGEPDSQHSWVPQVVLEGQTELQEDLGKGDFHRVMEQGKGQGLENRPKAQCCVSKFVQLCRRAHLIVWLH